MKEFLNGFQIHHTWGKSKSNAFELAAERRTARNRRLLNRRCIGMTFQFPSAAVKFDLPKIENSGRRQNTGGKGMFHILWYLIIGLLAGLISKSVMHVHITLFWTLALGVIGSVLGGGVTHMILRPKNERYHPAGLIFSTLGAILVLFICHKLNIHFPSF
jgi:uncharacterized membrane protein YeaQ/YmgE (transglycosylase-associated protein family)